MTKQRTITIAIVLVGALVILFLCSRSGGAETDYSLKRQIEALAARIGTLETRVGKLERAEKDAPRPTTRRRYPWEEEEKDEDAEPTPVPTPHRHSWEPSPIPTPKRQSYDSDWEMEKKWAEYEKKKAAAEQKRRY